MRPTPLIAVTATSLDDGGIRRVRVNEAYGRAIAQAGGVPLILPPRETATHADTLMDAVDALLLSGGEDIEPARYGESIHPSVSATNAARDSSELALIAAARAARLPVLAICRGLQLINVAHGGTLVQDIGTQLPGALPHQLRQQRCERVHDVKVEESSRLAAALGTRRLAVNSVHHQALRDIGAGWRVVARAPDGIVEGLEWSGEGWWAVGVQWHPEELLDSHDPWDRALFAAFVRAAAEHGASSSQWPLQTSS